MRADRPAKCPRGRLATHTLSAQRVLCCYCYVLEGYPPVAWHPACRWAMLELKRRGGAFVGARAGEPPVMTTDQRDAILALVILATLVALLIGWLTSAPSRPVARPRPATLGRPQDMLGT